MYLNPILTDKVIKPDKEFYWNGIVSFQKYLLGVLISSGKWYKIWVCD